MRKEPEIVKQLRQEEKNQKMKYLYTPSKKLTINKVSSREKNNFFKHLTSSFIKELKLMFEIISIKNSKYNDIKCHVPKSTKFAHHGIGVVMNPYTKLGENIYIYQNVTIGTRHSKGDAPTIKDNVTINANATILGDIVIHENSIIGAGAVVLDDVPPNSVVAGVPARVIKKLDNNADQGYSRSVPLDKNSLS